MKGTSSLGFSALARFSASMTATLPCSFRHRPSKGPARGSGMPCCASRALPDAHMAASISSGSSRSGVVSRSRAGSFGARELRGGFAPGADSERSEESESFFSICGLYSDAASATRLFFQRFEDNSAPLSERIAASLRSVCARFCPSLPSDWVSLPSAISSETTSSMPPWSTPGLAPSGELTELPSFRWRCLGLERASLAVLALRLARIFGIAVECIFTSPTTAPDRPLDAPQTASILRCGSCVCRRTGWMWAISWAPPTAPVTCRAVSSRLRDSREPLTRGRRRGPGPAGPRCRRRCR